MVYDYAKDRIQVNVVALLISSKQEIPATIDEHSSRRYATPKNVANAVYISGTTLSCRWKTALEA